MLVKCENTIYLYLVLRPENTWRLGSMFRSITNKMQRYTVYLCELLYMFRVDPPPIIKSTKLYLHHLVFVKPLLLPAAIVESLRLQSQLFHNSSS